MKARPAINYQGEGIMLNYVRWALSVFLSIFVIVIANSIISYGQGPVAEYIDPVQGSSSVDLVRRAVFSNAELAALRVEIDRARARLRQAGLRPNPSLDVEQLSGVSNSPGERAISVGVSIPIEIAGQRGRRIDLARAELEAAESEIADRERRLAGEV